jgi:hypothetical protein
MPLAARSGGRDSVAAFVAETVSKVLIGRCPGQEAVREDRMITDLATPACRIVPPWESKPMRMK